jgi:hypothetical protein
MKLSTELRSLMDQRRACWPDGIYPMPGDPRLDKAAELTVRIIRAASAEGLREVDAWNLY